MQIQLRIAFGDKLTKLFAVGTPVAGRPPHRSVREELPHTAPTSGGSRKAFDLGRDAVFCPCPPLHVSCQVRSMLPPVSVYRSQTSLPEFPLVTGLPSGTSATAQETTPYCSAPSSVLRRCQTARQRTRKDCGHGPSLTVPPKSSGGNRRALPVLEHRA